MSYLLAGGKWWRLWPGGLTQEVPAEKVPGFAPRGVVSAEKANIHVGVACDGKTIWGCDIPAAREFITDDPDLVVVSALEMALDCAKSSDPLAESDAAVES